MISLKCDYEQYYIIYYILNSILCLSLSHLEFSILGLFSQLSVSNFPSLSSQVDKHFQTAHLHIISCNPLASHDLIFQECPMSLAYQKV